MRDFSIDKEVAEDFEYIRNLCEMLYAFRDSDFAAPAQMEDIVEWERENSTVLPDQYKSWLLLTSRAWIAGGMYAMEFPVIGTYDEPDDVIIAASIIGDGETLFINRKTGEVFSDFEGETNAFDSFAEFLVGITVDLEDMLRDQLGDSWEEEYHKKFG